MEREVVDIDSALKGESVEIACGIDEGCERGVKDDAKVSGLKRTKMEEWSLP